MEAYFPRSDLLPIEEEDAAALSRDIPRGNGETILVLDPDRQRRTLLEEMLAHLGYEAVGFGQTQVALDAVARDGDRFDLALLDEAVVDPALPHLRDGPPGPYAGLPVLVIAERGSSAGRGEWGHASVVRLEKPLRMEALAMALSHEIQRNSVPENPPLQLAARRP
ncbi:hypothetical protein [Jiella pacifica]|uniref:hypothetical protein n=1 Tax=Jiella pacifica TaxID=2696469 RepID=UPI0028AB1AB7|nr:hypothetical protein [Jiella pacifica]